MFGHVLHCKSSTEVLYVLEQLFATKSKARLLQLCFRLQSTKRNAMTIEEYMLKFKSLAYSLMAVGQAITDEELVLYIIGGLGPKYESLVVHLTSKDSVTIPEL